MNIYGGLHPLLRSHPHDNDARIAMTDYSLLTFAANDKALPSIKIGDLVLPLEDYASVKAVLADWEKAEPALEALARKMESGDATLRARAKPLAGTRLLAPILYPDAILCAFANYTDHMKEMSDRSPPDKTRVKPLFFFKHPRSVVGPEETVLLPAFSKQVDWEAELAVVIGKKSARPRLSARLERPSRFSVRQELRYRRADGPLDRAS